MGRIRRGDPQRSTLHIPAPKLQPDTSIRFSFRYLDVTTKPKFSPERCGEGYAAKFLGRLRDVCSLSVMEFRTNKSKSLRAHTITWDDTTEKSGFCHLNNQLSAAEPWQFEITKSEH